MAYTLDFRYRFSQVSEDEAEPGLCTVRLQGEIVAYTDFVDPGAFVFMIDPVTTAQVWDHVATPCDYRDFNFEVVGENAYVRQQSFDQVFATDELAQEFLVSVQERLQVLCDSLAASEQYGDYTTVTISES